MLKGIYNPTKDMRQTCKTHTQNQAGLWEALNEKIWIIKVLMRKKVMKVKAFIKEMGLKVGFRNQARLTEREGRRDVKRGGEGKEREVEGRGRERGGRSS